MPNSRICTSRFGPSPIHVLCAFFASNSRFVRLFQAALDTPLDNPSLPPLSSRKCTLRFARLRFSLFFSSSAFLSHFFSSSAFLRDLFYLISLFSFLCPSFFLFGILCSLFVLIFPIFFPLRHFCLAYFVLFFLFCFFPLRHFCVAILSYFSYFFSLRHFCVANFVLFFLILFLFGISA